MITVSVPWPHPDLSPNARVDRWAKARRIKAYRDGCSWEAVAAGLHKMPRQPAGQGAARIAVHLHCCPPSNRYRDADNMVASMKSGLDGIAGVLHVNDKLFNAPTLEWGDVVKWGRVTITLTPVGGV